MNQKLLLLILLFLASGQTKAQSSNENKMIEEGTKLYKISLAFSHGREILKSKYPTVKDSSAGQVAYLSDDKTFFVAFGESSLEVVLSISFDNKARIETATVVNRPRASTKLESDLLSITKATESEIKGGSYKNYGNSHFTILPLIDQKSKRAYVLTTSERDGVITFGNDHLILFSAENVVTKRNPIHRNLMWTETQPKESGKETVEAWHTHLPDTGSLITATDICTLLLNAKLTNWRKYSVMSDSQVSVWDCEKNSLSIMPRQQWDLSLNSKK